MSSSAVQNHVIERHLSTQERNLVHVMLRKNLQCASDITRTLAREDVRTGQMTEEMYRSLQHKIELLQEGLQTIGRVAGIAPDDRDALDFLSTIPNIIRLQAG